MLLADKRERGRVLEANDQALKAGARAGMTLVQAQAAAGDVTILVHDAQRSAQQWEDVIDALDAVSPLIDDAGKGTAYLHMRGLPDGPQDWIARAKEALFGIELPFRTAVASNKFVSRAAAISADGTVCEPGCERGLVAPLSLELLEIEPKLVERLRLLGIARLGELAALPHGPFVRRFGSAAARWHSCAQGLDETPFLPRAHHVHIEAALYGEGSAQTEEQVYFALRMLVIRVTEDLSRLGKRAGILFLEVECEDAQTYRLEARIAQPTAQPSMLFDLMRAKVEGLVFDSPIAGLRLGASQLEDGGVPATLLSGSDPDAAVVELAIARLESALQRPPQRARLRRANRMEAQFSYDGFECKPAHLPAGVSALQTPLRPQMRLVDVTEIDVRMLQNAPAFVGSPPQAVVKYAGPWRVSETWFEEAVIRDEYDVLLEDGALYRIYRQGSSWYLQGAYD